MPNKIYKVLVTYTSGGNVYITAKNPSEAQRLALQAIQGGQGVIEPDLSCEGDYKAEDCQEVTHEELDENQRVMLAENYDIINDNN